MKMRRPHRVPLSRQAIELLEELRPLSGHRRYLFLAQGSPARPMCENTITVALRRLGFGQDEMTAHGFRAMAATLLNEMGQWNPDAIERQLAHMDGNQVRQAYARGQYWDERVRMMHHWSDYLDQLRTAAKLGGGIKSGGRRPADQLTGCLK
jgi:integrase